MIELPAPHSGERPVLKVPPVYVEQILVGIQNRLLVAPASERAAGLDVGRSYPLYEPHFFSDENQTERVAYLPSTRVGARRSDEGIQPSFYLSATTPMRFHPYLDAMKRQAATDLPEWAIRCRVRLHKVDTRSILSLKRSEIQKAGLHLLSLKIDSAPSLYEVALRRRYQAWTSAEDPNWAEDPPITVLSVSLNKSSSRPEAVSASSLFKKRRMSIP